MQGSISFRPPGRPDFPSFKGGCPPPTLLSGGVSPSIWKLLTENTPPGLMAPSVLIHKVTTNRRTGDYELYITTLGRFLASNAGINVMEQARVKEGNRPRRSRFQPRRILAWHSYDPVQTDVNHSGRLFGGPFQLTALYCVVPVPFNTSVCGLPLSLSVRLSVAVLAPLAAGVKVIVIEQVPPLALIVVQVLLVMAKSPLSVPVTVALVSFTAVVP
jgi:hypothetical protein